MFISILDLCEWLNYDRKTVSKNISDRKRKLNLTKILEKINGLIQDYKHKSNLYYNVLLIDYII